MEWIYDPAFVHHKYVYNSPIIFWALIIIFLVITAIVYLRVKKYNLNFKKGN